jgi:hypothetical protein
MKKITLILFTFIISSAAISQEIQKDLFESKVERYSKMKKNGLTMGIIGGVSTMAGIIMMSNADWEKETTATGVNYNTNDASGGAGILLTGVGVPLVITGIILGAIGNKKEKEYKGKLDNLSFQIKSTPQVTGFSLVYNF